MGVLLQAVPFLILGVLLSSALQTYVSEKWIVKLRKMWRKCEISTRLLTVLIIRVIVHTEQRKREKRNLPEKVLTEFADVFRNSKLKTPAQHAANIDQEEWVMLMPSIFGEDLFDDFMGYPAWALLGYCAVRGCFSLISEWPVVLIPL